ncbi:MULTISPECIES: SDR family NAD(P)-dependent oxidoreductase [Pseudonocardia]|uniref:Gluconate 5-dehydrogenase n=2 Tax=Pseudonocardia TaxID=1847 RepID=A0A1Y2MUS2_PSEAH|nr:MULTISPECIES: SDR family NAD(P)-dependent oxidoreductase [Pseudonocardia]OSY38932.1 Gluconate 5-dehydrogenase [Pseudonocardia autotrophica]TDN76188.1 NAD(P)-dependent dehydrogenase (short-subunit alcohol dehydrogenase family) [Pseudonocardia autotrophica]BBG00169.1 oxidoreductase [Pseudonocardia autotrophica]GEC26762.1 oxidoreductase [Pseudonocardia saturnea]
MSVRPVSDRSQTVPSLLTPALSDPDLSDPARTAAELPTAAELLAGVDLTGRRAVVTGAAAGVGLETARALAGAGAEVTLAVRDADAGAVARAAVVAETGNDRVAVGVLDLSDQRSIARFVRLWDGPLHMLVNTAGVSAIPLSRTAEEEWELHLAVNHLGPAALSSGLHWALAAVDGARVVNLSSGAHLDAPFDLEDPHFMSTRYDSALALGRSRTAAVLHAVEATRRWSGDGIAVNAVAPAANRSTPQQGAATVVLAAASPLAAGVSGRYFEDVAEAGPADPRTGRGVAAHALDPVVARRVWRWTERTLRETWFSGLPVVA